MNYREAIEFPFRRPRPWKNLAMMALCNLIPVIGPLVLMGFGGHVQRKLVRDLEGEIPEFDFDKFTTYLQRGVAPFLVGLIVGFAVAVPMWVLMFGGMILAQTARSPVLTVIGIGAGVGGGLMLSIGMNFIMTPFALRAYLLGNFGKAWDFGWSMDFLKRVFWPTLASMMVFIAIAMALSLVGLLACYFGMFFSIALIHAIHWHVQIQLYHLYLDRGGSPLPIGDDEIPPSFPVITAQRVDE